MTPDTLKESPLFWPAQLQDGCLRVLDETQIPDAVVYLDVRQADDAVTVIREMKTRAFGQLLVVLMTFQLEIQRHPRLLGRPLVERLDSVAGKLNRSRPTFPFAEVTGMVTAWAVAARDKGLDIRPYVVRRIEGYLQGIRARRHQRVREIAAVIQDGDSVLTHCNVSGELAMAAAICREQGKTVRFFATETRPYFQGARLTVWELERMGADVTLIPDSAAGAIMQDGLVNKVIVGSDRNCANGDFANKIGTYPLAVVAAHFGVPFYVLTQPSSRIPTGLDIPVESRDEEELLSYQGRRIVEGDVRGFYPGFDVIPAGLVTGGRIELNIK